MTTEVNTNPVSIIDHDEYPQSVVVLSNILVNEGDLVFWDGTNFTARPLTEKLDVEPGKGSLHSAGFMGIALGTSQTALYGGDPANSAVPVGAKMCVYVKSTAAEKYKPYDLVTVGADAQTVTKVGATEANAVGAVIIDPPAEARAEQATPVPEEIEGAAGVRIRIQLLPKHIVGKNI